MADGIFAHWPNRVTAMRFVGAVALFVTLAIWPDHERWTPDRPIQIAFWLFIVAACTDFVDGWLARRGNLVSTFGRIADPFVDKVLVLGSMVLLCSQEWSREWIPAWMVVVVLARELLVTVIRGFAESQGIEFPADRFGKVKMVIQCIAIGIVMGIFAFEWPQVLRAPLIFLGHAFVWATVISTLGSGISYVARTRSLVAGTGS